MQRFAEGIQAQGLHVVLDVRPGLRRVAAGERAELRRRHAHGATAVQQVFQADGGFAPPAVGHGVQGFHAFDFEHRADLQMVLQIGTHTRQVCQRRDAVLLQQRGRTYA